jgi:predicted DNA-binding protein with PD1-like motif
MVITADMAAGHSICDSIGQILMPLGITAAALHFDRLQFHPMRYVQPTYFDGEKHVAYYSSTRAPDNLHRIEFATATFGRMDGGPFIHCHALWRDPDGRVQGGHILPFEAKLAVPARMTAYATREALMQVGPDAETNFHLFDVSPTGTPAPSVTDGRMVVARIRPNEDLVTAIEDICKRENIRNAKILSGIGSTVGAVFQDQPMVTEIPTEILVKSGTITTNEDETIKVSMDAALIDANGNVHQGELARGLNPVLICFELFLQV